MSKYQPGFWKQYYKRGMVPKTELHGFAILTYKRELEFNGFGKGLDYTTPQFGVFMDYRTREFQERHSLLADGIIGPKTSIALQRKRFLHYEEDYDIPDNRLAKMKSWESVNDPAAVGPSGDDIGPVQIYIPDHPDVEPHEAVEIDFAAHFGGSNMRTYYDMWHDWAAATVVHNVGPATAKKWLDAGKPIAGGPKNSKDQDLFTICFNYNKNILGSEW